MPSRKSLSGAKSVASKTLKQSMDAKYEFPPIDYEKLVKSTGFPEGVLRNLIKEFDLIPKVKHDDSQADIVDKVKHFYWEIPHNLQKDEMILDSERVMGFTSVKHMWRLEEIKKFPFLRKWRNDEDFDKIQIPEDFDLRNMSNLQLLQDSFEKDDREYLFFPNGEIYNIDKLLNILKIFYNSDMKNIELLSFHKKVFVDGEETLPPLIFISGDYEAYLSPTSKYWEEKIIEGMPVEKFLWFGKLPREALKRGKIYIEAEKIYNASEGYRSVHRKIKNMIFPETIHELSQVKGNTIFILRNEISKIFSELGRGVARRVKGASLDKLIEVYEQQLKKENLTEGQEKILNFANKAIKEARQLAGNMDKKIKDIKSNLVNIRRKREINNKINAIKSEIYKNEFMDALKKHLPNIDYEYDDEWKFWVHPSKMKTFEKVVNEYYSITELQLVKREKITGEQSRIKKKLEKDLDLLSSIRGEYDHYKRLLNRVIEDTDRKKVINYILDLKEMEKSVFKTINRQLEKEGFNKSEIDPSFYTKSLKVGKAVFIIPTSS